LVPEFRERRLYNDAVFDNILTTGFPGQAGGLLVPGRRGVEWQPHSDGGHGLAEVGAADAQPFGTAVDARDRRKMTIGMTVSYPLHLPEAAIVLFPVDVRLAG